MIPRETSSKQIEARTGRLTGEKLVMKPFKICLGCLMLVSARMDGGESLPAIQEGKVPQNLRELWAGYDPRREPLETEVLKEWEQDGVVLRVIRYRIGVFKGQTSRMAAVYGFPKGGTNLPGLVQIHGGGQFADYRAPLTNAKRGYATISIAWAGRISAPDYQVDPDVVKLFWEGRTNDPKYKLTTDPNCRAICGASSGGICSFTVAWQRPDAFRKVLSHVGSFADIRGGHVYPFLVRKTPPKPIRVYLQAGANDLDVGWGDWSLANLAMASAFNFTGYDYHLEYGDGAHDTKHAGAILPESLIWLWR